MDVRGDIGGVGRRQLRKRRHAALGPALLQDLGDELAFLILEDELRSEKARPGVAARVGAVAERAVKTVERLPSLEDIGRCGRSRRIGLGPGAGRKRDCDGERERKERCCRPWIGLNNLVPFALVNPGTLERGTLVAMPPSRLTQANETSIVP